MAVVMVATFDDCKNARISVPSLLVVMTGEKIEELCLCVRELRHTRFLTGEPLQAMFDFQGPPPGVLI